MPSAKNKATTEENAEVSKQKMRPQRIAIPVTPAIQKKRRERTESFKTNINVVPPRPPAENNRKRRKRKETKKRQSSPQKPTEKATQPKLREEEDGEWAKEMEEIADQEIAEEEIHENIRKIRNEAEPADFEPIPKRQKKKSRKVKDY